MVEAELWMIICMVFFMTWELGCRDVVLESDSRSAIIFISEGCSQYHPLAQLINTQHSNARGKGMDSAGSACLHRG